MNPGVLALVGILALAVVLALWKFSRKPSIEQLLEAQGFEQCDGEASSLERVWRAVAGREADQPLRMVNCRRRAAGGGMLHHFTVNERADRQTSTVETAGPGGLYPAYLFDLRNPDSVSRGPVTIYVLPPGSTVMRKLLTTAIELSESRPSLDVGGHPWSASIVAAHGNSAGRLDDLVPEAVQEKLARAAAHGFFIIHLRKGKAAFATVAHHRDIDQQLAYLAGWL